MLRMESSPVLEEHMAAAHSVVPCRSLFPLLSDSFEVAKAAELCKDSAQAGVLQDVDAVLLRPLQLHLENMVDDQTVGREWRTQQIPDPFW